MRVRAIFQLTCALVAVAACAATATAQGTGVSLSGHSVFASQTEYTDVYFHKGYAYIGSFSTPGKVWIADALTTNLVATIPTSNGSVVRDLQVQGSYLYVALDQGGFDVVDVSNPAAPAFVTHFGNGFSFGVHDLFISGNTLYCIEDTSNSNLHVFNVTNPAAPVRLTIFDTPGGMHDLTVVGNRAYLANLGGGFQIVDVTNPAAPVSLLIKNYAGSFTHNIWPNGNGRYVCTTDEVCGTGKLRIWDVSNLANPVQVATYGAPNSGSTCVHNAMWIDNYIYMSYYTQGLRVVDATNPAAPVEVANYPTFPVALQPGGGGGGGRDPLPSTPIDGDTPSNKRTDPTAHDTAGGCFDGAWGVWAERSGASSVDILISDISTGLWSFRFPSAPNLATAGLGVFDSATNAFYLRNSQTAGAADTAFFFGGGSNLVPLSGDWDGNGSKTVGVYNPQTSTFYLKNANAAGFADVTVQFGPTGRTLVPVVGDWDGNDTETIGLYEPSTATFFLRNTNAGGNADLTFAYGPVGAKPIVGDWDASGNDTVGVYTTAGSVFYLRNSNSSGFADVTFPFGGQDANLRPVAGNWDAVGGDTIGLYNEGQGLFYLRNQNSAGFADVTANYGPASAAFRGILGDWTGPGF